MLYLTVSLTTWIMFVSALSLVFVFVFVFVFMFVLVFVFVSFLNLRRELSCWWNATFWQFPKQRVAISGIAVAINNIAYSEDRRKRLINRLIGLFLSLRHIWVGRFYHSHWPGPQWHFGWIQWGWSWTIFKLRITHSLSIFNQEQRGFQDDLSICVIQVLRLVKKISFS